MPQLPLDILAHILALLPISSTKDDSILAFKSFLVANSLLREAASIASLWEPHYRARYTHSKEWEEFQRTSRTNGDWRLMYFERRRIDRAAQALLEGIISRRERQLDNIAALHLMSFDVWDILSIEANDQSFPAIFNQTLLGLRATDVDVGEEKALKPFAITRRYWARSILNAISRSYAINLWERQQRGDDSISFVDGLSALSCFDGQSPVHISNLFQALIHQCREYLTRKKCVFAVDQDGYDLHDLCMEICHFMQEQGFGPAEPHAFHIINNILPHRYLTTNKKTIPLSLVHVFIAIARGLDVEASPVDFPRRVIAHIRYPSANEPDFYVDVFGASEKTVQTLREDVRGDFFSESMEPHFFPSTTPPMLLRTSRNILAAINANIDADENLHLPPYLAFTLYLIVSKQELFAARVASYAGLVDSVTVIPTALRPIFPAGSRIREYFEDHYRVVVENHTRTSSVSLRSAKENQGVKHYIGMTFTHRLFKYVGCIHSWDNVCKMDDRWIAENDVEELPHGSKQPFYAIFALDGTERYVAQDNIVPFAVPLSDVLKFFSVIDKMPAYFSDVENDETSGRVRLIMSPAAKRSFPEDDTISHKHFTAIPTMPVAEA